MKKHIVRQFNGKNIHYNIPSGIFEINLPEGSVENYYIIQEYGKEEEISIDFKINLSADSHLNLVIVSLSGRSIINNFTAEVAGAHSECNLSGIYVVDGQRIVENNIVLNHTVAECNSNQLFKGIVDDNGIARFYGLIKVNPDSQKIEAYQANHNLLMSDAAKAYTRPQLEIYADDVKCSHGATVGKLDEEQEFYLRSRGIGREESRALLESAFLAEVIEKIADEELRRSINSAINDFLGINNLL